MSSFLLVILGCWEPDENLGCPEDTDVPLGSYEVMDAGPLPILQGARAVIEGDLLTFTVEQDSGVATIVYRIEPSDE